MPSIGSKASTHRQPTVTLGRVREIANGFWCHPFEGYALLRLRQVHGIGAGLGRRFSYRPITLVQEAGRGGRTLTHHWGEGGVEVYADVYMRGQGRGANII